MPPRKRKTPKVPRQDLSGDVAGAGGLSALPAASAVPGYEDAPTLSPIKPAKPSWLSWVPRSPAPAEGQPQEAPGGVAEARASPAAQCLAALSVFTRRHPVITSVAGIMATKTVLQLTGLDFCFITIP